MALHVAMLKNGPVRPIDMTLYDNDSLVSPYGPRIAHVVGNHESFV